MLISNSYQPTNYNSNCIKTKKNSYSKDLKTNCNLKLPANPYLGFKKALLPININKIHHQKTYKEVITLRDNVLRGLELIKKENYSQAAEHLTEKTAAARAGLKVELNKTELDVIPEDIKAAKRLILNSGGYYLPINTHGPKVKLKLYDCKIKAQTPEQREVKTFLEKENSLIALEEWTHALQDASGEGVSAGVRALEKKAGIKRLFDDQPEMKTALKLANERGKDISKAEWIKFTSDTFGTKMDTKKSKFVRRIMPNHFIELDIAAFFREHRLPYEPEFLAKYKRSYIINR